MFKYCKIINEETKECDVATGNDVSFYQEIGMELAEVEKSYNGRWYVAGYAPIKPEPTIEEQNEVIRSTRAILYQTEVDTLMCEYARKNLFGLFKDGEEETLKDKILSKVSEIKGQNPYVLVLDKEMEISDNTAEG